MARRPDYSVDGISGTQISAGQIIRRDDNTALRGRSWAIAAERMRREDAALSSNSYALAQTLLSASFAFECKPDAPLSAQQATAYLNEAFGVGGKRGRLRGGFEGALRSLVGFVDVGYRYAEEVYEPKDGRVWLRRYLDCTPSAHYQWLQDSDRELSGVNQLSTSGETAHIPATKMLLLTLRRDGDDYEGVGLLRPCYVWWQLKQTVTELLAVGCDRMALPIPMLETDRTTLKDSGYKDDQIATLRAGLEQQLEALMSHERAYIKTVKGLTVSAYAPGASFDPASLISVVQLCDEQMAAAYLLGFLRLGVTDTGSRAVGETLESFFRRACVNILDQICGAIGGPAGPGTGTAGRLLAWNFPDLDPEDAPRLVHKGLTVSPLVDLLSQLPALKGAGFLTPDSSVESAIRSLAGLDPLDPSAERDPLVRAGAPGSMLSEAMRRVREVTHA